MVVPMHSCVDAGCSCSAAGRPLPPLFNWLPNELAQASPELYAALQPGAPAAAAGAPL